MKKGKVSYFYEEACNQVEECQSPQRPAGILAYEQYDGTHGQELIDARKYTLGLYSNKNY
jgi:hypothetical protein